MDLQDLSAEKPDLIPRGQFILDPYSAPMQVLPFVPHFFDTLFQIYKTHSQNTYDNTDRHPPNNKTSKKKNPQIKVMRCLKK